MLDMEKFQTIIGLPIPQAMAEVMKLGHEMRVTVKDGAGVTYSQEYLNTRVNVETSEGIVTKVLSIG